MMDRFPIWALFSATFLFLQAADCAVEVEVKNSLIDFLGKLIGSSNQTNPIFGWDNATDPCRDDWKGIVCDKGSVNKIYLNGTNLSGVFDAGDLCNVQPLASSLVSIKLDENSIGGPVTADIGNCKNLTHFILGHNQFSGNLPGSVAMLSNLKVLDISYNNFSGNLPDLSRISCLTVFLAQHNQLTGMIPAFNFLNLWRFDVSYNNLSGPIPDVKGRCNVSCFANNPGLCGYPLPDPCPSSSVDKGLSGSQVLMYSGYVILVLVGITAVTLRVCKRNKPQGKGDATNEAASVDEDINNSREVSNEFKYGESRSQNSMNSAESSMVSASIVVITSPVVNGLKFEDLLRAPAELLGRGKHGSLYKVMFENGMVLAVKRIKDWTISSDEFKQRMSRIYQASHPNVLPALAFYSSRQEKLLVYEYQQNGSLFRFLQGTKMGRAFDWASRLGAAATIAEALAFMHQELYCEGIAHGNLKSSNILLNRNKEPCISEYGLMVTNDQVTSSLAKVNGVKGVLQTEAADAFDPFKADIYSLGVILLELLTGKLVQNNGMDLTTWVHSVVREEWTVEVFDKFLVSEGASEERMVNLLQVAIKCVNQSPEARPTMNQVVHMINAIKEDEERSVAYET